MYSINFSRELEFHWQLKNYFWFLILLLFSFSGTPPPLIIPLLPLSLWCELLEQSKLSCKSCTPTCILPSLLQDLLPAQRLCSCSTVWWCRTSFRQGGCPEDVVGAGGFTVGQVSCCALWEDLALTKLANGHVSGCATVVCPLLCDAMWQLVDDCWCTLCQFRRVMKGPDGQIWYVRLDGLLSGQNMV